jgi:hypothetical protein
MSIDRVLAADCIFNDYIHVHVCYYHLFRDVQLSLDLLDNYINTRYIHIVLVQFLVSCTVKLV